MNSLPIENILTSMRSSENECVVDEDESRSTASERPPTVAADLRLSTFAVTAAFSVASVSVGAKENITGMLASFLRRMITETVIDFSLMSVGLDDVPRMLSLVTIDELVDVLRLRSTSCCRR